MPVPVPVAVVGESTTGSDPRDDENETTLLPPLSLLFSLSFSLYCEETTRLISDAFPESDTRLISDAFPESDTLFSETLSSTAAAAAAAAVDDDDGGGGCFDRCGGLL
jgi:hypothetical protein